MALLITFLFVIESIVFFGHWAVYRTLLKFWPDTSGWLFLWPLTVFLSLTFVLATLLANRFFNQPVSWFYYLSAVWLGTLHLLVWASAFLWLVYGTRQFFGLSFSMNVFSKFVFLVAIFLSLFGLWNSYQTKVVSKEVSLPNLPASWKGKRVAVVADTHLGNVRNIAFAKKVAKLIEKQNVSAVLIPGDFYDGPPANFEELAKPFGSIVSEYGTFFANGNHEEFQDSSVYVRALEKAGVKVLNNKTVEIAGLQLAGVTYRGTGSYEGLSQTLGSLSLKSVMPTILLKHVPNALKAAEDRGVALTVSGHSHGGQVWPGMYITRKVYGGYDYGLKPFGKMLQLTTSGAGTWGPPQRLGTQSEVVVLTLK